MSTAAGAAPVRVALLGAGTVGSAVATRLVQRATAIEARVGAPVQLIGVGVRDLNRPRDLPPSARELLTDDIDGIAEQADLVVETMGGIEPARGLMERSLRRGTPVVTANKQVVARHGRGLIDAAADSGARLDYEAAVGGAVPVLRVVRESLAGDEITAMAGILNGSTNFILDMVERHHMPVGEAVRKAGELGYLEADPSEDLDGIDAAAKIVILARAAWGVDVAMEDVQIEGIAGLTDDDFEAARGTGHVIKLIASAWRTGSSRAPRVELAVRPVSLAAQHPMAQIREGRNVVEIEAESAGTVRLFGAGAGGDETASAVLGDIVSSARLLVAARSHG